MKPSSAEAEILRFSPGNGLTPETDLVAAEEPLEIRVENKPISVVMRTPGNDEELAVGFLFSEAIITSAPAAIDRIPCPGAGNNVLNVTLAEGQKLDPAKFSRHVFTSSSCGICGRTSIESVRQNFPPIADDFTVPASILLGLPAKLQAAQETFRKTGGLHASALLDPGGNILDLREDVGRHNALDKLIGRGLLGATLPMQRTLLLLSGRASFELMQKALAAGIPIVVAIGAPSSLAVEFAKASGQTLVGFLKAGGFNVYAGGERVACDSFNRA